MKFNFKDVQEFTTFKLPVGAFVCKIMGIETVMDKEYYKISYEIVEAIDPTNAEFEGMYTKRKKERDFDYPVFIASLKNTEGARGMLKGLMRAISDSNNLNWNVDSEDFEFNEDAAVKNGLKVGLVLGEEEYLGKDKNNNDKVKKRTYVSERRSIQALREGNYEIPEFKRLSQDSSSGTTKQYSNPFDKAKAENQAKKATEMPKEQPVDDNDDVPF